MPGNPDRLRPTPPLGTVNAPSTSELNTHTFRRPSLGVPAGEFTTNPKRPLESVFFAQPPTSSTPFAHCATCGKDVPENQLTYQASVSNAGDQAKIGLYKDDQGHTLKVTPAQQPLQNWPWYPKP